MKKAGAWIFAIALVLAGCGVMQAPVPVPSPDAHIVPRLLSVTPSLIAAGSPATAFILSGSGFSPAASVLLNSSQVLSATVMSSGSLRTVIPATALAKGGVASVAVKQQQQTSQPLTITIVAPNPPAITTITPPNVLTTNPSLTITVNGSGFTNQSVVKWNGSSLSTTFVSSSQLTAVVPAANYSSAGIENVTVSNGTLGTSGIFTVNAVAPLVFASANLPGGVIGSPYSGTVTFSGGFGKITFSIQAGGTLPAGLVLGSTVNGVATITGTPTAAGTSSFTIVATDASGSFTLSRIKTKME